MNIVGGITLISVEGITSLMLTYFEVIIDGPPNLPYHYAVVLEHRILLVLT